MREQAFGVKILVINRDSEMGKAPAHLRAGAADWVMGSWVISFLTR
jgi:hypothetical protein